MFVIIHYLSNYYNIYKVALLEATRLSKCLKFIPKWNKRCVSNREKIGWEGSIFCPLHTALLKETKIGLNLLFSISSGDSHLKHKPM